MGLFREEYWIGLRALLPGIFLTQGPNPYLLCFLHGQAGPLPLAHTVVQIFSFLAHFYVYSVLGPCVMALQVF